MNRIFSLIIADRNSRVRNFLKRELMAEGYEVYLSENGGETLQLISQAGAAPDLLVLDPNLCDIEESDLLKKLQQPIPCLPVVYHTFISDYHAAAQILSGSAFVEKGGSSVEELKKVIYDILTQI